MPYHTTGSIALDIIRPYPLQAILSLTPPARTPCRWGFTAVLPLTSSTLTPYRWCFEAALPLTSSALTPCRCCFKAALPLTSSALTPCRQSCPWHHQHLPPEAMFSDSIALHIISFTHCRWCFKAALPSTSSALTPCNVSRQRCRQSCPWHHQHLPPAGNVSRQHCPWHHHPYPLQMMFQGSIALDIGIYPMQVTFQGSVTLDIIDTYPLQAALLFTSSAVFASCLLCWSMMPISPRFIFFSSAHIDNCKLHSWKLWLSKIPTMNWDPGATKHKAISIILSLMRIWVQKILRSLQHEFVPP